MLRRRSQFFALAIAIGVAIAMAIGGDVLAEDGRQFPGVGRLAKDAEIKAWNIAIGPRGDELPAGSGNVAAGREIYAQYCAYCHGVTGQEGPDHQLVGGRGSLSSETPVKTIGSYWPYATTVYDYIARAMPFPAPGSLTPDQVYAVTAFLLYANDIIDSNAVLTEKNLADVVMPNREGFVSDTRPAEFEQHQSYMLNRLR